MGKRSHIRASIGHGRPHEQYVSNAGGHGTRNADGVP